jgi:anti-sigma-K factor RskA
MFERVTAPSAPATERAWALDVFPDEFQPQPETRETRLGGMSPLGRFRVWRLGTALAVAAAVIVVGVYVNSLRRTIQEQESRIATLKAEMVRQQELLALLKSPQVTIVVMNGLEASPQGHGKILWDAMRQKALLYVTNLPPPPGDKDYQLWQIVNNKPISAGVFNVSAEGAGFFNVEPVGVADFKTINAFAVTLEPKGGVPQPTGQMYLLGKPSL